MGAPPQPPRAGQAGNWKHPMSTVPWSGESFEFRTFLWYLMILMYLDGFTLWLFHTHTHIYIYIDDLPIYLFKMVILRSYVKLPASKCTFGCIWVMTMGRNQCVAFCMTWRSWNGISFRYRTISCVKIILSRRGLVKIVSHFPSVDFIRLS